MRGLRNVDLIILVIARETRYMKIEKGTGKANTKRVFGESRKEILTG